MNLEPLRADRGGISSEGLEQLLAAIYTETDIRPIGLMAVAPTEMEPERAFALMQEIRERILISFPATAALSLGMSGDFEAAIAAGATHLRIGSSILGSRGLPA